MEARWLDISLHRVFSRLWCAPGGGRACTKMPWQLPSRAHSVSSVEAQGECRGLPCSPFLIFFWYALAYVSQ